MRDVCVVAVVVLAVGVVPSTAKGSVRAAPMVPGLDAASRRSSSVDVAAGIIIGDNRFERTQDPTMPELPVVTADAPTTGVVLAGGAHLPLLAPSGLTTVWFVPMAGVAYYVPSDSWNTGIGLSAYGHLTFSVGGVAHAGHPWGMEGGLGAHAEYHPGDGRRYILPSILVDVVYAPEHRYVLRFLYDIGSTTIAETPSYRHGYSTLSIQFVYGG